MTYYELAKLIELDDGIIRAATIKGLKLLIVHAQGQTFIVEDRCPHMDAPLRTGTVAGGAIRCRAHGISFDLLSGRAEGGMSDVLPCLKRYSLVYEGNGVGVCL